MIIESAEAALAYTYAWWLTGSDNAARAAVIAAVDRPDVPGADSDLRLEILLRRVRAAAVASPTMCPASELALLHDAIGLGLDSAAGLTMIDAREARTELAHGRLEALGPDREFTITHPERLGGLAVGNPADVAAARQNPDLQKMRDVIMAGRDELIELAQIEVPVDLLDQIASRQAGAPADGDADHLISSERMEADWFDDVDEPEDEGQEEGDGEAEADEADEGVVGDLDMLVGSGDKPVSPGLLADPESGPEYVPGSWDEAPPQDLVSFDDIPMVDPHDESVPDASWLDDVEQSPKDIEPEIEQGSHGEGLGRWLLPILAITVLAMVVGFFVVNRGGQDQPAPEDTPAEVTGADPGAGPALASDGPATDDAATDDPATDDAATDDAATDDAATDDAATDDPVSAGAVTPGADPSTGVESPEPGTPGGPDGGAEAFTVQRAGVSVGIGSDPDFDNPEAGPFDPVSVTVEYEGARVADVLVVDWTVDGQPFAEERVELSPLLSTSRFSKQVPQDGWPAGQHTLTFVLERTGEEVGTAQFRVIEEG